MTGAQEPIEGNDTQPGGANEPPPVLKSWKNIYWVVLGNLVFWISLFTYFTWKFQ